MKKLIARTAIVVIILAATAVSAKTREDLQKDLTEYRALSADLKGKLEHFEPLLKKTEAALGEARARYDAAHTACRKIDCQLYDLYRGYSFTESSLREARGEMQEAQSQLAKLFGELGDAEQRRAIASRKLDEAKKYRLDTNSRISGLYTEAEKEFAAVDATFWKVYQEEGQTRVRVHHFHKTAVQIEDKLSEKEFVRLREEALQLRVRVESMRLQKQEAERLAEAVAALLK